MVCRATTISSLVGMTQICVRLAAELIVVSPGRSALAAVVELDAQLFQPAADLACECDAVLADAAGEHDQSAPPNSTRYAPR